MPSLIWVNQFAILPGDGGGTRHFELGRELVRLGWKVTIFASDFHLHSRRYTRRGSPNDRGAKREVLDGVEMRWLWAAEYLRNDWRRARNWLTFQRSVLSETSRLENPPDVVIGSSPQIFAAVAGRKLARGHRAPFIFEVRDLWPESLLAAGGRRGLAYHYLRHVAQGLYRDADRVLVLARGTGDYLVGQGVAREKLIHVPNGVDVNSIVPAENPARVAVGASETFTLIYAGAHGPANGLDIVLDAAEIIGAGANIRFQLIGDGPLKDTLRSDAQHRGLSHVEFLDPVSKYELAGRLAMADAGLMVLREAPLFSFGVSPNKLFDYLAAGLPVICNVPGEVESLLAAADAGIQVRNTGGMALAEGIRTLVKAGPQERRRKGLAGRAWVKSEHSREVLGQRLDAYLRELLR